MIANIKIKRMLIVKTIVPSAIPGPIYALANDGVSKNNTKEEIINLNFLFITFCCF